jgi:uncharacterized membrane protein
MTMSMTARTDRLRAGPIRPRASLAPPWLRWATLALSAGGLGVSLYLTIAHYATSVTLTCPATGIVNCAKVTTSPQSVLFGVPVAVIGLAYYAGLVALTTPVAWRSASLRWVRAGALAAGIAFVLYLVYTELFTLDAICLWCTSVHVITVVLFVLVAPTVARPPGAQSAAPEPEPAAR